MLLFPSKVLNFVNFLHCFCSNYPQVTLGGKLQLEIIEISIPHSSLIRESLKRYHCESDMPLLKPKVICYYLYTLPTTVPLNKIYYKLALDFKTNCEHVLFVYIVKQNKNNSRIFTKNFVDFQNFQKFNEDQILMETNI